MFQHCSTSGEPLNCIFWGQTASSPTKDKKTELKFVLQPQNRICSLNHPQLLTAKSLQSCPTLCDPTDGSPPGSPVPGILQARTLEWVAISFSNVWKWKVKVKSLSGVWPSAIPWTAAYQAPSSMGFSRQQYLSGVPLPSPNHPQWQAKTTTTTKLTLFKKNNYQTSNRD